MNKIYDKLILVIALLLLAGGAFLYQQKSGQVPATRAPVDAEPADNPYEPTAVPTGKMTEANWPEVEEQSTGWRYDVFTPPKIFIDELGQFSQEGWEPPLPPAPFGIYLAEIVRKPYRIQFEGYIEEDRDDPSKTLLLMFDEEAQIQVRVRPGVEKPDSDFKLLRFDIERVRDSDGNIEVIAEATILDQRTGEEVVLTDDERLFESGVTVVFRSDLDASYQEQLTEVPASFEGPDGSYTLLKINLEDSSVTVEKHVPEELELEADIRRLPARAAQAPEASASPRNSAPAPKTPTDPNAATNPTDPDGMNENILDLMF